MNLFELTRALVDIDSTTGLEKPVGDFLLSTLSPLAARYSGQIERIRVEPNRDNVYVFWDDPVVTRWVIAMLGTAHGDKEAHLRMIAEDLGGQPDGMTDVEFEARIDQLIVAIRTAGPAGQAHAVLKGYVAEALAELDEHLELVDEEAASDRALDETIARLATEHRVQDAAAAILTATVAEPAGLGRVIRGKDGRVARVVEHADATPEEREINEINTSIYCFRRGLLAPALRRLRLGVAR